VRGATWLRAEGLSAPPRYCLGWSFHL